MDFLKLKFVVAARETSMYTVDVNKKEEERIKRTDPLCGTSTLLRYYTGI
jgi:hypothetical protein